MKQYYVILSEGAYSDYSPIYFVGNRQIAQEELNTVGKQKGDIVINEYHSAPERPHVCKYQWCCMHKKMITEKYDPITNECLGYSPDASDWIKLMKEWLASQGFFELPENIPEINTCYSDFPSNI